MAAYQKMLARALTHHQAGRVAEADDACGELLSRWPNDPDALNLRAVIACMNGRFADGRQLLERLLARRPDNLQALTTLGDTLDALGEVQGTIDIFRRALEVAPRDAKLHSRLGTALLSANDAFEAEAAYRQSIALAGRVAQTHFNHGVALHRLGRMEDAALAYRTVLSLDPHHVAAHLNLGNTLMDLDRIDDAVASYRAVIALQPNSADGHSNLGLALLRQERLPEATECQLKALECDPQHAGAHAGLGAVCRVQGHHMDAVRMCERALALKPDLAEASITLGTALLELDRADEALTVYQRARDVLPNDATIHANIGVALIKLERHHEAAAACRAAIGLRPAYASAYSNLGVALLQLDCTAEAIAATERAIEIDPTFAKAHSNLSECLKDDGRIDEAFEASRLAISLPSHDLMLQFNHALALLMEGNYEAGWAAYEVRRRAGVLTPRERVFPVPEWRGETLADRTLLLHAEQGLGDTLQFVRYVQALSQTGVSIVIECQRPLVDLLRSIEGVQIVPQGAPLPPFDLHLPLMSLPHVLGTRLHSIPASVPYLTADAVRIAGWKARLGQTSDLNVGVVWSGNPEHKWDRRRTMAASDVLPALAMPGVKLFSLQKDPRPHDRGTLHALADCITDLAPELVDFSETAAAVAALDLVIAVDTAVAHLAGALGRPVWLVTPYALDWRWLRDREDSPWYPTMRLFRQSVPKVWDDVLLRIRSELTAQAVQKQNGAIF